MCGIVGITAQEDVVRRLFNAIQGLEYRGYDSCGLGVLHRGRLEVRKNIGDVQTVNEREDFLRMRGGCGIAHTRWATHGEVTQANAHPQLSANARFGLAHNGIITNHAVLRKDLKRRGVAFHSQTDTEVIVHLVAQAYEESVDVGEAVRAAASCLEGSYAFCLVSEEDPQAIHCVRNGSPLVLGLGEQTQIVASDLHAVLPLTRRAMIFEDGEYGVLRPEGVQLRRLTHSRPIHRQVLEIPWNAEASQKGGHAHYMLKEIFDQPHTARVALSVNAEAVSRISERILYARRSYLLGVGTTYYVAQAAQYFFSQYSAVPLQAVSADEFPLLIRPHKDDFALCVSQSGETYDTRRAMEHAQAHRSGTGAIVNMIGSSLAMAADEVILQGSGPELCVVSTKAALAQWLILLRIALELGRRTDHLSEAEYRTHLRELENLPQALIQTLNERSGFLRNLATRCAAYPNWFVLGRGIYAPLAMEAALKIKEVSYLHVEGMGAGFLKHGSLALVDEQLLNLFLVPPKADAKLREQTLSSISEVRARRGMVVGFCSETDKQAIQALHAHVPLPERSPLSAPIFQLVAAQMLAYYTALHLGRSIDKPRNLAKSVTVE